MISAGSLGAKCDNAKERAVTPMSVTKNIKIDFDKEAIKLPLLKTL